MTRLEELARKHGLTTRERDGNGLRVGAIIPTDQALAFGRELISECARIAAICNSNIAEAIRALAEEGKNEETSNSRIQE